MQTTTDVRPVHLRGSLWAVHVGAHEVFRGCARDMQAALAAVREATRAGVVGAETLAGIAEAGVWRRYHPGGEPPIDPLEVALDLARAGAPGYSVYLNT